MAPRLIAAIAVLAAVTAAGVLYWARSAPPAETEGPLRPGLRSWELLGCYELQLGPWEADRPVMVGHEAEAAGPRAEPGAGAADAATWEEADATAAAAATQIGLAADFPDRLLLQADSLDEWGRPLGAYRATPLVSRPAPGALPRFLRWLVRADTLWLLGSNPSVRAGAALFATGDSLVGRARARRRADSLEASTRVVAWRMNCATGARDVARFRR